MIVTAWGVHTCTNWFQLHTTIAICYNATIGIVSWPSDQVQVCTRILTTSPHPAFLLTLYMTHIIECCMYTHTHTQTYPISARNSCSFLCPFVVHTLNLHTYIQVMIQTMTVTYVTLAITLITIRGKYVCTESCKYIHTLGYLHAVYAEWQKLSYSVQCLYSNKRSLRWH